MWWSGFGRDDWRASSAKAPDDAERVCASKTTDSWPTPGELFLEAGIVLVSALGFVFAMTLLLSLLGIPHP